MAGTKQLQKRNNIGLSGLSDFQDIHLQEPHIYINLKNYIMSYRFDIDELDTTPDRFYPLSMSQFAKKLNLGKNKLLTFLRNEGVLHPNNQPGWASEDDWFIVREISVRNKLKHSRYITKKGAMEIRKLIDAYGRGNIQKLKVKKPDSSGYLEY